MVIHYQENIGFQMQEMVTSLTKDSIASFVISFLKKHQIPYAQNTFEDIFCFEHVDEPVVYCSMDGLANLDNLSLLYNLEWEHNPPLLSDKLKIDGGEEFGLILQLKMLQKYPNLNFIFNRKGRTQGIEFGELFEAEDCIL